jgi:hypothetical protein
LFLSFGFSTFYCSINIISNMWSGTGPLKHIFSIPVPKVNMRNCCHFVSHMWFLRRYINFSQYKSMIEWIEKPLCFENNSSSIYAKFGSNCSKDFWEIAEMWKANGHKVTTIPHIDLWIQRYQNKNFF